VIKSRCDDSQLFFGVYRIRDAVSQNFPMTQHLRSHCINKKNLNIIRDPYISAILSRCVVYFVSFHLNETCVRVYVCVCAYISVFISALTLRHYPHRRNNTPNLDVRYVAFYGASIFDRARDRELDFRLDYTILFAKRCETSFVKIHFNSLSNELSEKSHRFNFFIRARRN